jgi:hypothetical protein
LTVKYSTAAEICWQKTGCYFAGGSAEAAFDIHASSDAALARKNLAAFFGPHSGPKPLCASSFS